MFLKSKSYPALLIAVALSTPFFTLASGANAGGVVDPPENVTELLNRISTYIINPLIYVLFTAGFVVFIWGLVQFVAHLDNEEARATGGKHMLWGIIGMVVMVGVVGIVNIIQNTIASIGGA
ncbi:MAG: hypothetical protein Q7R64_00700 [bacterium]|nr:hypothetical protein [bacterium]